MCIRSLRQSNSDTFHLVFLRVEEDGRANVVLDLQLLHGFEPDQIHSRIFKLLEGVDLVPLHHDLLVTVKLQHTRENKITANQSFWCRIWFVIVAAEILYANKPKPGCTWDFLISLGSSRLPVWVWKTLVLDRTGSLVSLYSLMGFGFRAVTDVAYIPTATFIPSPRHRLNLERREVKNKQTIGSQSDWVCLEPWDQSLPGDGSLLLLLGAHPLLQVLQFVTRLQLQPQLALVLRGTHNVPKEGRDVKSTRFHQMQQIDDDT